jgi:hypothetical protein
MMSHSNRLLYKALVWCKDRANALNAILLYWLILTAFAGFAQDGRYIEEYAGVGPSTVLKTVGA